MSDFCPKCGNPWSEHRLGAPKPACQYAKFPLTPVPKPTEQDLPESEGGLTD